MQIKDKSIYDPCPYGYRVPPLSSFSVITGTVTWMDPDLSGGREALDTWWPASGLRTSRLQGVPDLAGSYCYHWSATPHAVLRDAHIFGIAASGTIWRTCYYRSAGMQTRCIPE